MIFRFPYAGIIRTGSKGIISAAKCSTPDLFFVASIKIISRNELRIKLIVISPICQYFSNKILNRIGILVAANLMLMFQEWNEANFRKLMILHAFREIG
jgi:hypothetical protein